ncbi:hypothetical protein TELCIR_09380, partial [Teladorsagia circumcincta]
FWFYNAPTADEACEADQESVDNTKSTRTPLEHAHVEIERMNFTLEAGSGTIPVPLIFMQMLVKAEASSWSSALQASANLSLQMSYYNESLSVWEPVIEPVETGTDSWAPWNLSMTVKGRNKNDPADSRPAMDVKIDADDMLNMTITKTFISLLNHEFANAAKKSSPPLTRHLPGLSPFLVLNETGIIIKIAGSDSIQQDKERLSVNQTELSAYLRVNLLDTVRQLKIGRADKVSIPLPKKSDAGKQWKV